MFSVLCDRYASLHGGIVYDSVHHHYQHIKQKVFCSNLENVALIPRYAQSNTQSSHQAGTSTNVWCLLAIVLQYRTQYILVIRWVSMQTTSCTVIDAPQDESSATDIDDPEKSSRLPEVTSAPWMETRPPAFVTPNTESPLQRHA